MSGPLRAVLSGPRGDESLSLGQVASAFDRHGAALLLGVFALLTIALTAVPGLSAPLGMIMAIFALQMITGGGVAWLPQWAATRKVNRAQLRAHLTRVMGWIEALERRLSPRLTVLTGTAARRVLAVPCLLLTAIIILPIPLANAPAAAAILLIVLGLIGRDGAFVVSGLVIGALTLSIIIAGGDALLAAAAAL